MTGCNGFGDYILGIFGTSMNEVKYFFWAIVFLIIVIIFHDQIKVFLDIFLQGFKKVLKVLSNGIKKISNTFKGKKRKKSERRDNRNK